MALFESDDLSELRLVFGADTAKRKEQKALKAGKLKTTVNAEPSAGKSLNSDVWVPMVTKRPTSGGKRPRISSVEDLGGVKEGEKWTFSSSAQSLSTALNDPACRELDLFTKTWGSSFNPTAPLPPSHLPPIGLADFLCYLKDTTAGRKQHRALVRQITSEDTSDFGNSPRTIEDFRPWTSHVQQDGRSYSIDIIPRIFFQHDFSLRDPPTFQDVLPLAKLLPKKRRPVNNSHTTRGLENGREGTHPGKLYLNPEGNPQTSPRVSSEVLFVEEAGPQDGKGSREEGERHQSMKLLHEKLTHYLDVVEVHLAYHISQRSDVFFSTLTSQQDLESFIMVVRQDVMELRHKLRQLDKDSSHTALRLYSRCRRRQRLKAVYEKARLVATVQQTQPTIQLLLKSSDFVGALDLIVTTQEVLQQELQGVHALRHLGCQLSEIEGAICLMMEADLVEYVMKDVRARLDVSRLDESKLLEDTAPDATPSSDNAPLVSEEKLGSVVLGLLRQDKLHFLPALREALLVFLKAKVKGVITGYLQQEVGRGQGEEPPSLADCMRTMQFQDWMDFLTEVCSRLLHFQKAIKGSLDVIKEACQEAAGINNHLEAPIYSATPTTTPTSLFTATPTVLGSRDSLLTDISGEGVVNTIDDSDETGGVALPGRPDVLEEAGLGVIERFEVQSMAQEASDLMDQLAMDEALSDATLGGVTQDPINVGVTFSSDFSGNHRSPSVEIVEGWGRGVASGRSDGDSGSDLDRSLVREEESTGNLVAEQQRVENHVKPARLGGIISVLEGGRLVMECDQLLAAGCNLIHARCAKLLTLRAKAGLLATLPAHDFLSLVNAVEGFIRSSTQITGLSCPQLRAALLTQARTFLDTFHDNCKRNLSLLLESERWRQSDIPTEVQALVHRLESGAGLQLPQATPTAISSQPPAKYLVIHGANFAVLSTVLHLIKRLLEYSSYAETLPMLINDIMTKLIDIIKYFNMRTRDLVLGAGAMNAASAAGLRNITARHLAIMLRCLQAVALLVPDLKIYFQTRLSKQQHVLLNQFDIVTMDLAQHCERLQDKLRMIMDEAMNRSLSKWDAKPPVPSLCFKNIVKKVVKMHENVVDILPPQQVELLFAGIEVAFRTRLREHLLRLGIRNDGSSRHGLVNRELHHLEGALGSMDNVSAFGSSLFDVWIES